MPVIGDQIYIAGLLEAAAKTPVGETWMLERDRLMDELGLTADEFSEVRRQIEQRMTGKWDRAVTTDRAVYVYIRTG